MMSQKVARIVSAEESDIHDEPHVKGSRITVKYIYDRVVGRGLKPETVADRHDLPAARVYEAVAYYYNNPEEMRRVEERHEKAVEEAERKTTISPKDEE